MRLTGRPIYYLVVAAFLAGATLLRLSDPFAVQALRYLGFDLYQRLDPAPPLADKPVAIVDIDEASLKALGQWPWPRTRMAELASRLTANGAAAVAFDILFSEADQTSPEEVVKRLPPEQAARVAGMVDPAAGNDNVFAGVLASTPSVLGISLSRGGGDPPELRVGFATAGDDPRAYVPDFTGAVRNLPTLEQAAQGVGSINWIPDRDQIVRRVPLVFRVGNQYVPSLAAEALRVAQGAGSYILKASNASGEEAFGASTGLNHIKIGAIIVPTDSEGAVWLRFRPSDPGSFIPAMSVLDGTMAPDAVNGRIVLVGTSAAGLLDLRATPIDVAVPGVEIHAQVIEHILSGRTFARPDFARGVELLVMVLLGIGLAVIAPRLSAIHGALLGFATIGGLLAAGYFAFDPGGLLFDVLYPALVLILLTIGTALYTYREAERSKAGVRRAFQYYVSPDVVDEIIADPSRLELGGEVRVLTLLFCDVRGFTTISEGMTAHELTRFINNLLTPLSEIILKHRGTIDKYMGDAIMAFWNAPLDDPDHARHAINAAEEMLAAMAPLNEAWQREAEAAGRSMPLVKIGVGVNTGECCVGNLGSATRFDYSCIGDEVNVASRFESLTKEYGLTLLMGEQTARLAGRDEIIEVDRVQVRGKTIATRLFTLAPKASPANWLTGHRRFIDALGSGDLDLTEAARQQAAMEAPVPFGTYYERIGEKLRSQAAKGKKSHVSTVDV
ncbi:adenylate/guanylate cyclase domain-containing protein [Kaistia algarum]|uniref:CHASE2 domain-containing protein n=1 Tax=Kaistia algarum TaxID=2083279 RepID=UPI000CE8824B|nr:adenylate/guanylate cyclase domain-containing protein [Kaistia algarum]MCX5512221.1 adenylate/guanylate cyclase domain-containing protein [Kaistia algarum]PPE80315.1 adenylate/guanylate cyclase domain-containing protein [Kaistia algarum]